MANGLRPDALGLLRLGCGLRRRDADLGLHGLPGAADVRAPDRGGAQMIQRDGETHMPFAGRDAMGWTELEPAQIFDQASAQAYAAILSLS